MKNRFGVDVEWFEKELATLNKTLPDRSPGELFRYFNSLAFTALNQEQMHLNTKDVAINQITADVHENAVAHGWWDEDRSFGDIAALIHSEISEALEEYRNGKGERYFNDDNPKKPEGIAVELADVVIRVMDFFGRMNWDLAAIVLEKHEYNKTRPYKHGGKVI